jgi:hypothetical protein
MRKLNEKYLISLNLKIIIKVTNIPLWKEVTDLTLVANEVGNLMHDCHMRMISTHCQITDAHSFKQATQNQLQSHLRMPRESPRLLQR